MLDMANILFTRINKSIYSINQKNNYNSKHFRVRVQLCVYFMYIVKFIAGHPEYIITMYMYL